MITDTHSNLSHILLCYGRVFSLGQHSATGNNAEGREDKNNSEGVPMTRVISETKRANEQTAYQLGWMAYERGDDEPMATADDEFCALAQESGNVGALIRAYNMGFDDAMYQAMCD